MNIIRVLFSKAFFFLRKEKKEDIKCDDINKDKFIHISYPVVIPYYQVPYTNEWYRYSPEYYFTWYSTGTDTLTRSISCSNTSYVCHGS